MWDEESIIWYKAKRALDYDVFDDGDKYQIVFYVDNFLKVVGDKFPWIDVDVDMEGGIVRLTVSCGSLRMSKKMDRIVKRVKVDKSIIPRIFVDKNGSDDEALDFIAGELCVEVRQWLIEWLFKELFGKRYEVNLLSRGIVKGDVEIHLWVTDTEDGWFYDIVWRGGDVNVKKIRDGDGAIEGEFNVKPEEFGEFLANLLGGGINGK